MFVESADEKKTFSTIVGLPSLIFKDRVTFCESLENSILELLNEGLK